MSDDFPEFDHRCEGMPNEVVFHKSEMLKKTHFEMSVFKGGVVSSTITFFGFRYCPYCGKDMKEES